MKVLTAAQMHQVDLRTVVYSRIRAVNLKTPLTGQGNNFVGRLDGHRQ